MSNIYLQMHILFIDYKQIYGSLNTTKLFEVTGKLSLETSNLIVQGRVSRYFKMWGELRQGHPLSITLYCNEVPVFYSSLDRDAGLSYSTVQ